MCGRCPRWGWLLLVAVANLAVWVGLAVGVATLAGDPGNVGIEALMRRGEGTAAAYLHQPTPSMLQAAGETVAAIITYEVDGSEIVEPERAGVIPEEDQEWLAPSPVPPLPAGTGLPTAQAAATAPVAAPEATPAPSGAASSLVLSDPGFSGLMQAGSSMELAPRGQRVEIHYEEAALNEEIAALLAGAGDLPYRNVRISLHSDRILVTGEVTVLGLHMNAELLGTLIAEECALRMDIQGLSVGGVLTPRFMKNQASTIAVQALDWYPADSPVCLDEVVLGNGAVTVYGYRR